MRYLRRTTGLLLAVIMCLNVFFIAFADDEISEEPVDLPEVYSEIQVEAAEPVEQVDSPQEEVAEPVEQVNSPQEEVAEPETQMASTQETTETAEVETAELVKDTGSESEASEQAVAEENIEEKQLTNDVLNDDQTAPEAALPVQEESGEKAGESISEEVEASQNIEEEKQEETLIPEEEEDTPEEETVAAEETEPAEEEIEVAEEAVLILEEVLEEEILEEVLEEETVELEPATALTRPPEDVTLNLNTIQNFYLDGAFTQKILINLSSPGYLNLFIRFIDSPQTFTRATVRFTNSTVTSTYLNETISFANSLAEISDWFDAGTYILFVEIVADNGDNYWPISYSVENMFAPKNIEATNGNISSAATLPTDGTYHGGLLSRTSNSRWWKVTLTQAGFLEVDVRSFVQGQVASDVYLLREGQINRRTIRPLSIVLAPASPTAPQFRYASTWLEAGDYYVNVFAKDQRTGEYSLMVSFQPANNDESANDGTYLNANRLVLDGNRIRGLLSYTDEVDMFVFNVAETTNVQVSVAAFMNSLNVKLYNSNMRKQLDDMSASNTGGTMNKAHNHEDRVRLDPGNYVLVVSRDPNRQLTGVYEARARSTITIRSVVLTNGVIYNLGDTISGHIEYGSGTPLEYYFHLQILNPATGEYDNVSHLTKKENAFAFTPNVAGVYRVLAQVTDGVYNDEWASEPFTVKDRDALNINSVDYNPDVPVAGQPMTITAGIGGGRSNVKVIYEIYTSGGTLVASITTDGGPCTWTPANAGNYKVQVVATDGVTWVSKWGAPLTVNPAPALTIDAIELSTTYSVKKNSPLTLTAYVINGTPIQYVYEVYYFDNFFIRSTSTSNVYTFRPNASGKWKIMVVATDGKQWTSRWSDEFIVEDAPSFSVTVVPDNTDVPVNGTVNFELKYSGNPSIVYTAYEVWKTSPSVKIDEWKGNSNKHSFAFATPGTYRIMAVVKDSSGTWKSVWSPIITVAAPPVVILTSSVPNTTSCFVNDVVTYTVTHSSGTPTLYYYYVYNSSNAVIYSTTSTSNIFKYQFKSAGTFKMMAVATDGYTWSSVWSTPVTVSGYGAFKVLRVDVKDGLSKTFFEPFTVSPVFSNGSRVRQIFYEVYDAATNDLLAASGSTKKASYTYKPQTTAITDYKVMVVGEDDTGSWASLYSGVITYSLPTALSIGTVTDNTVDTYTDMYMGTVGAIELGDSVEFRGTTKNGAEVFESEFQVYYKQSATSTMTLIDTVNSRNNGSLLFTPANRGFYQVMYVAYDGITWASKFSNWIYVTSDAY